MWDQPEARADRPLAFLLRCVRQQQFPADPAHCYWPRPQSTQRLTRLHMGIICQQCKQSLCSCILLACEEIGLSCPTTASRLYSAISKALRVQVKLTLIGVGEEASSDMDSSPFVHSDGGRLYQCRSRCSVL